MSDKLEIKILPWIGYNQLQAQSFGLNHTQAIIMNYIVASIPFWADSKEIDGEVYFRANSSKFLSDMPTLQISRSTLTKNVTELVDKGLIKRKIVNRTVPYFKATEKWLYEGGNTCVNSTDHLRKSEGQYNIIISQIKKEKNGRELAEKLILELSSYLDGKKKHENVYLLDDIKGGQLVQMIKKKIEEIRDGNSGIKLESKSIINQKYIDDCISTIIDVTKRYDKLDLDVNGNPTVKLLAELVTEVEKLFDWYSVNEKKIKDIKSTIRNWINNYFKRQSV